MKNMRAVTITVANEPLNPLDMQWMCEKVRITFCYIHAISMKRKKVFALSSRIRV
jgi:hypothetical protein